MCCRDHLERRCKLVLELAVLLLLLPSYCGILLIVLIIVLVVIILILVLRFGSSFTILSCLVFLSPGVAEAEIVGCFLERACGGSAACEQRSFECARRFFFRTIIVLYHQYPPPPPIFFIGRKAENEHVQYLNCSRQRCGPLSLGGGGAWLSLLPNSRDWFEFDY